MTFKSFLSAAGHDFMKVFTWLGSSQGQAVVAGGETAAVAIASAVGVGPAVTAIIALVNAGLQKVLTVEAGAAAAGMQSGTGTQKLAAVVSSLTPEVESTLKLLGVPEPTAEQSQALATAIGQAVSSILNSIPAPTTTA